MASGYQFLRPVAFLKVKGPGLGLYKFVGPVACSVACVSLFLLLPAKVRLIGDGSATEYMIGFFSILPGFFIAALAAIVAFQGGDLDETMPDVTVEMSNEGDTEPVEITLRVFLCYLFAYLTVLSFLGFFLCVGGALLAPSLGELVELIPSSGSHAAIKTSFETVFVAVLALITASVVLCTAQGLYFLAERVHQKLL